MTVRPAGPYVVRITADDVGSRVSIRFRLPHGAEAGGPGHSDVVGRLEIWERGVLGVTRRDGRRTWVPESLLVAGRVVPERS